MKSLLNPAVLVLLSGAISSCAREGAIEPGPDTGPLTAFIDGAPFVADVATVTRRPTGIVVNAQGAGRSIRLEFPDLGARNFVIGRGNPVLATITIGTSTWRAEGAVGRGTITVDDILPSFLAGSFDLTLGGESGQADMQVTRGRFEIIG